MGGFVRTVKRKAKKKIAKIFKKEPKIEIKKEEPKKEEIKKEEIKKEEAKKDGIKLSQKGPTKAELEKDEAARLISIKRRGRKSTKLRKTKADDLTLATKSLLG